MPVETSDQFVLLMLYCVVSVVPAPNACALNACVTLYCVEFVMLIELRNVKPPDPDATEISDFELAPVPML